MSRTGESTQGFDPVLKARLPKVSTRGSRGLGRGRRFLGLSFFKRCALLSFIKCDDRSTLCVDKGSIFLFVKNKMEVFAKWQKQVVIQFNTSSKQDTSQ